MSQEKKNRVKKTAVNIGGKGDREKEMSKRDTEMKEKRRKHSCWESREGEVKFN